MPCVSSIGNPPEVLAAIFDVVAAMRPRRMRLKHRADQDSYNNVPFLESRPSAAGPSYSRSPSPLMRALVKMECVMAVRTTVIGSWWPYPEDETDLARYHAGKLSATEGEAVLKRAATRAIAEQRSLGLTEWTGGEYHTDNFIMHMHACLTGVEVDKPQAEDPFDYDDLAHARVTGKLEAPNGLGYAAAYRREKNLPGGVNKAAVVGLYEVAVSAMDQLPEIQKQHANLTALVNRELCALDAEGCPNVQLDAPFFGVLVNVGAITAKQAADLIAPCFEGVKATKSLHLCNGNLKGRPVSALRALGGNPYSPRWRCRYRGVGGQILQPMERARRVQAIAKEHVVGGRHCR
jgi:methionine synthase II (cobalamin-independent)